MEANTVYTRQLPFDLQYGHIATLVVCGTEQCRAGVTAAEQQYYTYLGVGVEVKPLGQVWLQECLQQQSESSLYLNARVHPTSCGERTCCSYLHPVSSRCLCLAICDVHDGHKGCQDMILQMLTVS